MTKQTTDEAKQKVTEAEPSPIIEVHKTTLNEAVNIVNRAIVERDAELKRLSEEDEHPPIPVWGRTSNDYEVQAMVDPKIVARIMLEFDYSIYDVLKLDAPEAMWNEIAYKIGLAEVSAVDL